MNEEGFTLSFRNFHQTQAFVLRAHLSRPSLKTGAEAHLLHTFPLFVKSLRLRCLILIQFELEEIIMVLDIHLGDTYGALFIGLLISAVLVFKRLCIIHDINIIYPLCIYSLFGITNLQVFVYFQSYKNDRIWSKLAVSQQSLSTQSDPILTISIHTGLLVMASHLVYRPLRAATDSSINMTGYLTPFI